MSTPGSFDDLIFTEFTYEPGPRQRWSTWNDVQAGCHGPEPRPDWVITARAAMDTDLGAIKSGKEADCFLLERAIPDTDVSAVMVGKRYRDAENRLFHRKDDYTQGARTRNSRDVRAMAKKTGHGRAVAAGQWAGAEWTALNRMWQLGLPVPYPVQIDGTEILMELIDDREGQVAPRLAETRPDRDLLAAVWDQVRESMIIMTRAGIVHGDLSPYNMLLADERLVIIDVPQLVDLIANPQGFDLLHRDCRNVSTWFVRRGLGGPDTADELFAELMAYA